MTTLHPNLPVLPFWFPAAMKARRFVVLDTETTGLEDPHIVAIAVISAEGTTLLDTLVRPAVAIPAGASAVHGISDADVSAAPRLPDLLPALQAAIGDSVIITYNAEYDRRALRTSIPFDDDAPWLFADRPWCCAMDLYARFWGDWNAKRHSWRWQKLSVACEQQRIPLRNAHRALDDALMTLALLNHLYAAYLR
jgi:DNA polymerase III epsilon subunit-like protein